MEATITEDQIEVNFSDIDLDYFSGSREKIIEKYGQEVLTQQALTLLIDLQQGSKNRIIPTAGIYPNPYHKRNGVTAENMLYHMVYNLVFRPGRTFFVNHEMLYAGGSDPEEQKQRYVEFGLDKYNPERDTQPYV